MSELAAALARIEELAETSALPDKPDWTAGSRASFSLSAALIREAMPDSLDAAWQEAEAALPEGWLFHGVSLADHSMDGGGWGPDWMAAMTWPGHCEYDDCDHDDAFIVEHADSPASALRALTARLRERA